jgi:hypothetical protein
MPVYVVMAYPQESEPPTSGGGQTPEANRMSPDGSSSTGSGDASITPEQLAKVIRRLETGFYDRAEVREEIARRVLDDPDQ